MPEMKKRMFKANKFNQLPLYRRVSPIPWTFCEECCDDDDDNIKDGGDDDDIDAGDAEEEDNEEEGSAESLRFF